MKTKKQFSALIISAILYAMQADAATLYSRSNGTWSSNSNWSYTQGGASCSCSPGSTDVVIISHTINMDKNLSGGSAGITSNVSILQGGAMLGNNNWDIDFRAGSSLDNNGMLIARNVTFYNGTTIMIATGASLIVTGNLDNRNNSNNITFNGTVTVNGSFSNGNGGIIAGSGNIEIINGPVTNTGTTFAYSGISPCAKLPCTILGNVALPVEWLSFKAKQQQASVLLTWSTATESNNDFFTIEKGTSAGNFVVLGSVRGAGNATQKNDYNFSDNQIIKGTVYYRIGQTDLDGKQTYSDVISINTLPVKDVKLSPNPLSTNRVKLESNLLDDGEVSVKIFDMKGKEVKFEIFPSIIHGEAFIQFEQADLIPGGMYQVNIVSGNQINQEKLLIQ